MSGCFVDSVENLSTGNVEKRLLDRLLCGQCGKLIHKVCGKLHDEKLVIL